MSFDVHSLASPCSCLTWIPGQAQQPLTGIPASALAHVPSCCQHFSWCSPLQSQVWSCVPLHEAPQDFPKAPRVKAKAPGITSSPASFCATSSFFLAPATSDLIPSFQSSIFSAYFQLSAQSLLLREAQPVDRTPCYRPMSIHDELATSFHSYHLISVFLQTCEPVENRFCLSYYLLYL